MLLDSEDFFIDLSPSCTTEQAVFRLLGWGTETIKKKYILMNTQGHIVKNERTVNSTVLNLHEILTEIYQKALERIDYAAPENPTDEQLDLIYHIHQPKIDEAKAFVHKAHDYFMDITDELARHDSEFRIDQKATAEFGSTHITIRSLDEWSQKRYGKSEVSSTSRNKVPSGVPDVSLKDKKSTTSLYVTLGLAIRVIAELKYPRFGPPGNELITQIASLLETEAKNANGNRSTHLASQQYESIRARLTRAKQQLKEATQNA